MATALAVGAGGALWVIFDGDWQAARAFHIGKGEVIYFVGCIAHAAYTPMVRRLNRGEPAVMFTFGMLLAGFVVLVLFGWADIRATEWGALPPIVWVGLFYLAIFASAATFVLLQFATLRLPSAKVMAYTYLTPSLGDPVGNRPRATARPTGWCWWASADDGGGAYPAAGTGRLT